MTKVTIEFQEAGGFSLLEALAYSEHQTVAGMVKLLIDRAIHDFQEANGVMNDHGSIVDSAEDRYARR